MTGDRAVGDLDVARHEPAGDDCCFDAEPHSERPPDVAAAAATRSRAAAASTPARSDDDRNLRVAVRRGQRGVDGIGGRAGRLPDDPADAGVELLVRRGDVDHQVAEGLPEPDHRDRRDHVQDELLRRARLEPRRAGEHLGADGEDDLVLREARQLGVRGRDDADRQRAGLALALSSAPTTHGVRPLALTATTASAAETPASDDGVASGWPVVLGGLLLDRRLELVARDERQRRGPAESRRSSRTRRRRARRGGPTSPRRRRRAGRPPARRATIASTARGDRRARLRRPTPGTAASAAFIRATSSAVLPQVEVVTAGRARLRRAARRPARACCPRVQRSRSTRTVYAG